MKTIAAAFGTLLIALTPCAFAAPSAPVVGLATQAAPSTSMAPATGTPPWLAASAFCSGNCDVYCGSGAIERYYEPSAACCTRNSCLDGSGFIMATWNPPSGCWGGGECAVQ
jgi:hypothetical protein